jgi:hypothetical protein
MDIYYNASGQRINNEKSYVFFRKGCSQGNQNNIKHVLQVSNEALNGKYLGLPSDVGRSKNWDFAYLKDRIWKHVQG